MECCICNQKSTEDDIIVNCSCGISVHKNCYGIKKNNKNNKWKCSACSNNVKKGDLKCILCAKTNGAMKKTTCNKWAHVVCSLFIPEVFFENNECMEPINIEMMPPLRFSRVCYICSKKSGACIKCIKKTMFKIFSCYVCTGERSLKRNFT